ncbi:MAG: major capsid protein [Candidatus Methanomethylicaceae archaeon]
MKKRQKHNLSHYRLLTGNAGQLIPVSHYEVLPGDTVQQSSSCLLRASPLLAPVMHRFHTRLHTFFVPFRLLDENWEAFITGRSTTAPATLNPGTVATGDLLDYLGVKPGTYANNEDNEIVAFPVRAYNMIWNEYFRDQDIQSEVSLDSLSLQRVAWGKDYFTSARPWPQKGAAVTLPIGDEALVRFNGAVGDQIGVHDINDDLGSVRYTGSGGNPSNTTFNTANPPTQGGYLYADLSGATAGDVRDVRVAFALQRYEEARAMYGSRYTEYLRYLGIRPSDARLQRPEYLGGGKRDISFSEVLQTAEGSDPVGTMRGHGISGMSTRPFRRFFEEHGVVITLLSVRPQSIYQDGLHRSFLRRTKEDYYQEELQYVGQQEIFNAEVYFGNDGENRSTFGFNDRYSEYTMHPSGVAGEFRNILNFWHAARDFSARPALNDTFITCTPPGRIFAVPSEDTLWLAVQHRIGARRLVKSNPKARII